MALVLITHPADGVKDSIKKNKVSKNKNGSNCLEVRVNRPVRPQVIREIRDFRDRSIVPFEYKNIKNPKGYPDRIVEVVCSSKCMGNEMNVAPIRRNIHYLRREGKVLVLDQMMVTVGCTCVYPDIREQHMT
ncbi:interleukin-17A-like [Hyla sarda]|uniref:interleukin-17A-like n=1 Tax=Hyla sarda TaxID=327740 RepID=UPI0024C32A17|nr:interleukin-17A-like [Hyla sarda]